MKKLIQASVVQYAPGDMTQRAENLDYILLNMENEAKKGRQLVVFPEVSITGFFRHEPGGVKTYWEQGAITLSDQEIQRICGAAKTLNIYTIVGFAERSDVLGKIYNSAALIGPDGVVGTTRKIHRPGLEKLYFSPGERVEVFDCELGRIGIAVCYDSMFPEYIKELSKQAVDIIVFSSSIWRGGAKGGVGLEETKKQYWSVLPVVTAIQNQAFVVSCNACGSQDMGSQAGRWERLGLSQIVAPTGDILGKASESGEEIISASLKQEMLVEARTSYRFLEDRMMD